MRNERVPTHSMLEQKWKFYTVRIGAPPFFKDDYPNLYLPFVSLDLVSAFRTPRSEKFFNTELIQSVY